MKLSGDTDIKNIRSRVSLQRHLCIEGGVIPCVMSNLDTINTNKSCVLPLPAPQRISHHFQRLFSLYGQKALFLHCLQTFSGAKARQSRCRSGPKLEKQECKSSVIRAPKTWIHRHLEFSVVLFVFITN